MQFSVTHYHYELWGPSRGTKHLVTLQRSQDNLVSKKNHDLADFLDENHDLVRNETLIVLSACTASSEASSMKYLLLSRQHSRHDRRHHQPSLEWYLQHWKQVFRFHLEYYQENWLVFW